MCRTPVIHMFQNSELRTQTIVYSTLKLQNYFKSKYIGQPYKHLGLGRHFTGTTLYMKYMCISYILPV